MGILSSQGEFSGTLADLRVKGSATSPDSASGKAGIIFALPHDLLDWLT